MVSESEVSSFNPGKRFICASTHLFPCLRLSLRLHVSGVLKCISGLTTFSHQLKILGWIGYYVHSNSCLVWLMNLAYFFGSRVEQRRQCAQPVVVVHWHAKERSTKCELHDEWAWVQPRVLPHWWHLPSVSNVCKDHSPPIDSGVADVWCMLWGCTEG
jgi:hypothetical protein